MKPRASYKSSGIFPSGNDIRLSGEQEMGRYLSASILAVLVMVMMVLSGCETDLISVGVRDTPVPEPVEGPGQAFPVPSAAAAPVPSGTVTPAPTLSETCRDLLAAAGDDQAFMKTMADHKVYAGICSLANDNCTIRAATDISQVISTGPKPKTPLLVQAREHLLSASTYCLDPTNSVSRNRTRNDLDTYVSGMSRYAFLVSSCPGQSGEDIAVSLKKTVERQGETLFRGTGNAVHAVNVRTGGNTTFSLAYSGSSSFMVMLQDSGVRNIALLANSAGSYEGKRSLPPLNQSRYSLNITATGPWSVLVTSPG
jgi:hypothetical protein